MALCVFGFAQVRTMHPPQRQLISTADAIDVTPTTMQPVITYDGGKHIYPTGPAVPCVKPDHQNRAHNGVIFDSYEGGRTGDNSLPTDGQYDTAAFPCALGGDSTSGYRWYYGNGFNYPEFYHHVNHLAQAGVGAKRYDALIRINGGIGSTMSDLFVFTYNDTNNELDNPASPTFTFAVPSAANAGVHYNFATPLSDNGNAGGQTWRVNSDLSTFNGGAGLTMPTNKDGWIQELFAQAYDAGTNTITTFTNGQPMQFGTQGSNGSMTGRWSFSNSDGTTDPSGFTYYWDWSSGYPAMVTSGTVTRGTTIGAAIAPADISGGATFVSVTQALQAILSRNNAEITVTVTLNPATYATANLNMARLIVYGKANASPVATSTWTMSLQRNATAVNPGQFDSVLTSTTHTANYTGSSTGDWVPGVSPVWSGSAYVSANAPYSNLIQIPNYVTDDGAGNRTAVARVGVKQLAPSLLGWKLTVNLMYLDCDQYGPASEAPGMGFFDNF